MVPRRSIPSRAILLHFQSTAALTVFSVPLRAIKSRSNLGQLDYRLARVTKTQRRLAGRIALEPDVELNDFACRAVIDFIVVQVHLGRRSHHQWLRRVAGPLLTGNCYVKPVDGEANGVADRFAVRVQEPDVGQVRALCDGLEAKFGFKQRPRVVEIEFSVDFTPKTPDARSRAKLFMVLTRHFLPTRDVLSVLKDRPRFTFARGRKSTIQVIKRDRYFPKTDDHHRISDESGRSPFVDACYYLGARKSDSAWRIMDKVVDRQDPASGRRLDLDEKRKRIRVEVTLQRPAVLALGIDTLANLPRLRFATLQGGFFRFALPTFAETARWPADKVSAARAWLERNRTQKFLVTGIVGLQAMDEALERQHKSLRLSARADFRRRGVAFKPMSRVGAGPASSFVAYDELNTRVATALTKLGARVRAEWSAARPRP